MRKYLVAAFAALLLTGIRAQAGAGGHYQPPQSGGGYRLVRIEVIRTYAPADWMPKTAYLGDPQSQPQILPPDQRAFRLGWDFNWGDNKQNHNRSIADVTLTQVPLAVEPGSDASLAAEMHGDWNTSGYGNARDHTISLTGAAGAGQWSYGGDPNSSYQGSFKTANKVLVPQPEGGRIILPSRASLRFGSDHTGEMEIRLIYEPSGAGAPAYPSPAPPFPAEMAPSRNATPEVMVVDPSQAARGSEVTVRLMGRNFFSDTAVTFFDQTIRVLEVVVPSSTSLVARVYIPRDAATGTTTLSVRNPSGRSAEAPFTVTGGASMPAFPTAPAPPRATTPSPDLVAWWKFDEGRGMVGLDSSGNQNKATLVNATTWAAGKLGGAISFNGVNSYVTTEVDVQPGAMPSTTWTAWVYPMRAIRDDRQFVLSDNERDYGRTVYLTADDGKWAVLTGTGRWEVTPADMKQWQHIAVVFTPSSIEFYKNGMRFSYGRAPKPEGSRFQLVIGKNPPGRAFFLGLVDDVRIYNRALSAGEIQAIYNSAGMISP